MALYSVDEKIFAGNWNRIAKSQKQMHSLETEEKSVTKTHLPETYSLEIETGNWNRFAKVGNRNIFAGKQQICQKLGA